MPKKKSRVRKQKKSKSKSRSVNNLRQSLNRINSSSRKQKIIKKQNITRKKNRRKNKSTNKQNGKNKGNKLVRYRGGGGKKRNGIKTMKKKKGKYMLKGGMQQLVQLPYTSIQILTNDNYEERINVLQPILNEIEEHSAQKILSFLRESVNGRFLSESPETKIKIETEVVNALLYILSLEEYNNIRVLEKLKDFIIVLLKLFGVRIMYHGGHKITLTEAERKYYQGLPLVHGRYQEVDGKLEWVSAIDTGALVSMELADNNEVVVNRREKNLKIEFQRVYERKNQFVKISQYLYDISSGDIYNKKLTRFNGTKYELNEYFLTEYLKPEGVFLTVVDSMHDVNTHGKKTGDMKKVKIILDIINNQLRHASKTSKIWETARQTFPDFVAKIDNTHNNNIWGTTARPWNLGVKRNSFENIISDCFILWLQNEVEKSDDFYAQQGFFPIPEGGYAIIDSMDPTPIAPINQINGGLSEYWDTGNWGKSQTDQQEELKFYLKQNIRSNKPAEGCYQSANSRIQLNHFYEFPVYLPYSETTVSHNKDSFIVKIVKIEANESIEFNYYVDGVVRASYGQSFSGLRMTQELFKHVFGGPSEIDFSETTVDKLKEFIDELNRVNELGTVGKPNKITKQGKKADLINRIQDFFIANKLIHDNYTKADGAGGAMAKLFLTEEDNPHKEIEEDNHHNEIEEEDEEEEGCGWCKYAYENNLLPCKEFAIIQSLKFTGDFSYVLDILNENNRDPNERVQCPIPFISTDQNCTNFAALYLYNMSLLKNFSSSVFIPMFGFNLTNIQTVVNRYGLAPADRDEELRQSGAIWSPIILSVNRVYPDGLYHFFTY